MDEMVQHRVNAMMQSSFKKNQDRVPGLKGNDIEKLLAEGRCFRCKQKGHQKQRMSPAHGSWQAVFSVSPAEKIFTSNRILVARAERPPRFRS